MGRSRRRELAGWTTVVSGITGVISDSLHDLFVFSSAVGRSWKGQSSCAAPPASSPAVRKIAPPGMTFAGGAAQGHCRSGDWG